MEVRGLAGLARAALITARAWGVGLAQGMLTNVRRWGTRLAQGLSIKVLVWGAGLAQGPKKCEPPPVALRVLFHCTLPCED